MSEPLDKLEKKIDILLSADGVIVILDLCGTERFMNVKISSPEEIFGRHKDSLKNSYMMFRDDVHLVWKEAKQTKKFRKFPGSFKNISLLWSSLPENIKNIYMQIFTDYKKLAPRFKNYIKNGERLIQPEEIQRAPSDNVKTIEEKMGKTIGVGAGNDENLFLQRPAFLEGNGCSNYMAPYFDNQMVDQEAFLHHHMNMDMDQQQLVVMARYFDDQMVDQEEFLHHHMNMDMDKDQQQLVEMAPYFDNQMVDQEAFLHNYMNMDMDKQQQLVEMAPYFDNQMVDQEAFLHHHMNMDMDKQQQLVEMAPYFDNPMGHDLFYEVEKENEE
ncbi:hypothetical protein RhiirA4_546626 [Rhizophagus irregularis]|uniref:Uncharacterized protein n=1 Tax=Rhizophagus irregularis TaxID=588596 RepID=A0A2I1GY58_9GLOM|nr:hypothetical protein RhiirA4_546626 [Rhizophagus irregularis]